MFTYPYAQPVQEKRKYYKSPYILLPLFIDNCVHRW